jgi:hypothetical protein
MGRAKEGRTMKRDDGRSQRGQEREIVDGQEERVRG